MPDDDYEEFDETDEEAPSGLRKQLKASEAKARKLAEELAAFQRTSAFRDAGVDPNDPKARYFVKGYDGELTVEAIKAEAEAAGLLEQESTIPASEQRAAEQAAEITAGADAPQYLDKQAEYEAEMAKAVTKEEIFAVMDKYGSPRAEELI